MLRLSFSKILDTFTSHACKNTVCRGLFTSGTQHRDVDDRKLMLKSMPVGDEGTAGENSVDIDSLITR